MEALSLAAAAHSHPRRAFWIADGRTTTYDDALGLAARGAAALAAEGVRIGDRVAFVAEPTAASLVTLFAVSRLGATAVPLHPRWTARERDAAIAVARPARSLDAGAVRELAAGARRARGGGAPGVRALGIPFAVIFTSGSSAAPKGVELSARAFAASAGALAAVVPFAPRERWLVAMPLAHVGGLSIVTRSLLARRTIVLEPGFEPERVLRTIVSERITRLSVVPTMLDALLAADRRRALGRLSVLLVGGAACPASLLQEAEARGLRARTTWGLSECCSMATLSGAPARAGEDGSGAPLPGMEVEVRDDAGRVVAAGGEGRLVVRGPMVMNGYLGAPPLVAGEWLDTGDVGRLDARGRVHVAARRSDLIVTGGENVSPLEVEAAIESISGVRRALVFGVPDPRWGQIVAAAIVPASPRAVDEASISAALASSLAPFKRPRRIRLVQTLPELPSGKPDRRAAARLLGD